MIVPGSALCYNVRSCTTDGGAQRGYLLPTRLGRGEPVSHMTTEEKRRAEMQTVKKMLEIYCRAHHGKRLELCEDCEALLRYARARVERCPHMEEKTFCSACPTHCYAPAMREKIREAMRYSGPRMMLHAPVMALRHMWIEWREKRR